MHDVSLTLQQGQSLALMGNSGSGKSTLLQIAAGLEHPNQGQVRLAGQPLYQLSDNQLSALRRDKIGFVFQQFNLLPGLTVGDNILFQSRLSQQPIDNQWLKHLMTELAIDDLQHRLPEQLSGGQQQRVAIARAIAHKPCIVFADEPTGNLNDSLSHSVMALLSHLIKQANSSLLMVTHSAAMAGYADTVLELHQGQLTEASPA
nr:ABC transporter ATP-binding protein [Neiella litorisoli]